MSAKTVQIIVGTTAGAANIWDSGNVDTIKTTMVYGGGNNLEPGQRYYVSIRVQNDNNEWSLYETESFVMPHFENFTYKVESSSSSSSNSLVDMSTTYTLDSLETINLGSFSEVGVVFPVNTDEHGFLVIDAQTVKIKNSGGSLVFDEGGGQEFTFIFVGETYVFTVGLNNYAVTLASDSIISFIIHSE
jgi:hypothetical protein